MAPNYVDTNSLKLQAQSDVARVFSPQGRLKVLYQTLGEPVKITPPSSSRNLENKEILPCVLNSTKWLSSTRFRSRIEKNYVIMIKR
jgi:hypothetical protein